MLILILVSSLILFVIYEIVRMLVMGYIPIEWIIPVTFCIAAGFGVIYYFIKGATQQTKGDLNGLDR